MKILHVISSLEIGGAQRLLSELLPLLKEKGKNVSLLLLCEVDSDFEHIIRKSGIEIISLNVSNFYSPFIIFKLLKYFKQYDIIHAHLFPTLYWVAFAAKLTSKPIVYTEHSTSNRRRGKTYWRPIEKFIYDVYKKIISISPQTQSNLKLWLSARSDDSKFIVIENGVNLDDYKNASKLDEITGLPGKNKIVLMVSRFNKSKDQETVIRCIPLVKDKSVHFVFVGDGPNRSFCENLVVSLNITSRVHFLGVRSDIPQLVARSYFGIQSSNWEGFGLTSVEFMAGRKPIIASNVDGLKQVVESAGFLFEAGDEKELSFLIDILLENKEVYRNVSQKCFERSKKYDINTMADRYIQLYNNIFN